MNIALLHDGRYKVIEDIEKINNLLSITKYLVIDNTTILKGKTHTLIDTSKKSINIFQKNNFDLVSLEMELSYDAMDVPIDSSLTIKSKIPFNSIEKIFSVYPLIKQIFGLNYFKEIHMSSDYITLFIHSIAVRSKNNIFKFDYDECEGKINKYFKNLNLKTNVNDALDSNNHIILKKNEWYKTKEIPNKFEYLLYNLCDIETLYLLTEKQYYRLLSIKNLNIYVYDNSNNFYNNLFKDNLEEYDEEDEDANLYHMICNDIDSILEACIYFPQLIELEKVVYNRMIHVRIEVKTNYLSYNLEITEKETRENGLCLFKIINKLLQM